MSYKLSYLLVITFCLVNLQMSYAKEIENCSSYEDCTSMAKQGNHDAEYKLGTIYDLGKGIKADPKQALTWYHLAANGGHKQAEFKLGEHYRLNTDYARAEYWYQLSDAHGHNMANARLLTLAKLGLISQQSTTHNIKGSGFFIGPDYVVSNWSLVGGCNLIEIENSNIKTDGKIVAMDEFNNLVIIKTTLRSDDMLNLRNNPTVTQWEYGFAVGDNNNNPLLRPTQVMQSNLEIKERIKNKWAIIRALKLKATVQNGDGGGPVIDLSGNVIGINSTKVNYGSTATEQKFAFDLATNLAPLKLMLNKHNIAAKYKDKQAATPQAELIQEITKSIVEISCVNN